MKILLLILLIAPTHPATEKALVRKALRQIHTQLNVDITPRFLRIKADPCPANGMTLAARLDCYKAAFPKRPAFILTTKAPTYYGGIVNQLCDKRGIGMAAVRGIFPYTQRLIIAHELGHMLGASHFQGASIMSPSLEGTDFWPRSRAEVRQCLTPK